jgi:hypothetical protein
MYKEKEREQIEAEVAEQDTIVPCSMLEEAYVRHLMEKHQ